MAETQTLTYQEAIAIVHDVAIKQSLNSLADVSKLVETAKKLVGAKNGRLRFVDYTGKKLVPGTISGVLERTPDMAIRNIGECIVGVAAKEKAVMQIGDVQTHPAFLAFKKKVERRARQDPAWADYFKELIAVGSEIAVPIMAGKKLLGVLNVNSPNKYAFSEEQKDLLTNFANEVALCFLNRRSLILVSLHEIENEMVSTFDLKQVAERVARGVEKMFKDWDCVPNIFLYTEHEDKTINPFDFLTGARAGKDVRLGMIKPRYDPDPEKAGRGYEAIVRFKEGKEDPFVIIENVQAPDSNASQSAKDKGVKTLCVLPLTFKNEVVGILYLHFFKRHFFTEDEKTFLEMFAITTAFAIKNTSTINNATWLPTYGELIGNGLIDQLQNYKPTIPKSKTKITLNAEIWKELEKASVDLRKSRGDEEVAKVILGHIDNLCTLLKLPPTFSKIFCNFQENEKILYKLPYYRDHFIHSFHVFYLGYLILNGWWNNKVPFLPAKDDQAAVDEFLRVWFVASILHDVAYPIETTEKWVPQFPKNSLGLDVEIKCNFDWTPILLREQNIIHIQRLTEKFLTPLILSDPQRFTYQVAFQNWLMNQLLKMHDHGVLSCLALLTLERHKCHNDCVYEAALTVLLHNYVKNVDTTIGPLPFDKYPLAFLLAYCDNAQEWGRAKSQSFDGPQRFIDRSIGFGTLRTEPNRTCIVLAYKVEQRCEEKFGDRWTNMDDPEKSIHLRQEEEQINRATESLIAPIRRAWSLNKIDYNFCIGAQDEKGQSFSEVRI